MYDFFSMLSEEAAEASSFLGTEASEFRRSSSRLGWFGGDVSVPVWGPSGIGIGWVGQNQLTEMVR